MSDPRVLRRPFRRAAALAGAAAIASAALAGCASSEGSSAGGSGQQFIDGTGEITKVPAGQRRLAPALSGTTVQGKRLALSDYKGKVIVLNVWGSWCSPCRAEAPNLAKVAKDTRSVGVQFVGINTRDLDTAPAQAFERTFGVGYPSLYDPSGKLVLKFKGSLSPQAIPSTLIIDRNGKIAVRALKALGEQELRGALDPVVAEQP